jgi:hypothetical protein
LTFTSVPGGSGSSSSRRARRSANSAAASNVNPLSISWDTATEGMPIRVPSKAAETVPEYVTSSPRFRPRLMPEKMRLGRPSFIR